MRVVVDRAGGVAALDRALCAARSGEVWDADAVFDEVMRAARGVGRRRGRVPRDAGSIAAAEAAVRAGASVSTVRVRYGLSGSVAQRLRRLARGEG